MGNAISVVDAFTEQRFAGNPAGVCFPEGEPDAAWMQSVAREMNLSETAFLRRRADGYDLRWFTPAIEVDLCGHATLASAHLLWESGRLPPAAEARFSTRSGWLTARRSGALIEMDFPVQAVQPGPVVAPVLAALGVRPGQVRYFGRTAARHFIHVDDEALVRDLKPDFRALNADALGRAVVTAAAAAPGGGYDFVSRFFAPNAGIDEDPVTGSAHCCLAPYWASLLGKSEMTGYQASTRGGLVRVRPQGERVLLGGQAITVWRGELA